MSQHLLLLDSPKFFQIGIFGLKTYHLATLVIIGKGEARKDGLVALKAIKAWKRNGDGNMHGGALT
jgi:hypothetical protein